MTKPYSIRDGAAPAPGQEARLEYQDAGFLVQIRGDFVRCAATGERIGLDDLKYWSVQHQEAYLDAAASLERFEAHRKPSGGG